MHNTFHTSYFLSPISSGMHLPFHRQATMNQSFAYSLMNGTAISGQNFVTASGSVSFPMLSQVFLLFFFLFFFFSFSFSFLFLFSFLSFDFTFTFNLKILQEQNVTITTLDDNIYYGGQALQFALQYAQNSSINTEANLFVIDTDPGLSCLCFLLLLNF
jgi:hypothetical protein